MVNTRNRTYLVHSDGETEDYFPSTSEIWESVLNRVDRSRRTKRRKTNILPSYDYAMGDILVNEHLPSYEETMLKDMECEKARLRKIKIQLLGNLDLINKNIKELIQIKEIVNNEINDIDKDIYKISDTKMYIKRRLNKRINKN